MEKYFEQYYDLRKQLDMEIIKFEKMHQSQLSCTKGCDSCCEKISIFPIEYYAILKELEGEKLPRKKLKFKFSNQCRFLENNVCAIYKFRPIICRTQGLPLLYENSNGSAFELSVCHLNFKGVDVSTFRKENALFMPPYNSKLFLLNNAFIDQYKKKQYKPVNRIKVNNL